ncbi:MAG: prenyltransferase/squalene oxidase repeat-containing protein, partial [Planctomycetota bacterium]
MRQRHLWGLAVVGSFVLAGPNLACASTDQDPVEAAAEDQAVREAREAAEAARAAVSDASKAAKAADRARRRALLKALEAEETLLEALESAGDADGAAASRTRLESLYGKVGSASPGGQAPSARAVAGRAGSFGPSRRNQPARPVSREFLRDLNHGLDTLIPDGDRESRAALAAGLDWLARNQEPDGRWEPHGKDAPDPLRTSPEGGSSHHAPGLTGVAVLAFLGAGETHESAKYGANIGRALKYLKGLQDPEGCFGPRVTQHYVYNHALATLAFTEAYGMTKSPLFEDAARRGVTFILKSQNPYMGWRYGVRPGDNDTSVT